MPMLGMASRSAWHGNDTATNERRPLLSHQIRGECRCFRQADLRQPRVATVGYRVSQKRAVFDPSITARISVTETLSLCRSRRSVVAELESVHIHVAAT